MKSKMRVVWSQFGRTFVSLKSCKACHTEAEKRPGVASLVLFHSWLRMYAIYESEGGRDVARY